MAVDMEQVRAALEPEEPDYPRAAKSLGADALPHLERIITGDQTGLAAKAAYLKHAEEDRTYYLNLH